MANTLGPRRYYKYVMDTGDEYKYQTDEDLGTAVGAELNDTLPDLPRRFKPRFVWAEGDDDGDTVRKKLICPTTETEAYNSTASTTITIDGTSFKTTGRVGEKQTFGANPDDSGEGGGTTP